jgi:Uso1 / p115 like vesicle tethering protein, head region
MKSVATWLLGDFDGSAHLSLEASDRVRRAEQLIAQLKKYDDTTIATSSLTHNDKRAVVEELAALSKHDEVKESFQECIESLVHSLRVDRADVEIMRDVLDTIHNIISKKQRGGGDSSSPSLSSSSHSSNSSSSRSSDVSAASDGDGSMIMLNCDSRSEFVIGAPLSLSSSSLGDVASDGYVQLINSERLVSVGNGNGDGVAALLGALELSDFYVRYPAIEVLRALIDNGKLLAIQDGILAKHQGIESLLALLGDAREAVRNEAVLLLVDLTKGNEEIQKMVGFHNVFERLAELVHEQGLGEGGVIVADCVRLMINLLAGNTLNQSYFRETGCLARVLPSLLAIDDNDLWMLGDAKAAILMLALRLVSALSASSSAHAECTANQGALARCGALVAVTALALRRLNCAPVRIQALRSLGHLLLGHTANCTAFYSSTVSLGSAGGGNGLAMASAPAMAGDTSALARLSVVMLDANDIAERAGALFVFKCFLGGGSEEGQIALASTLTPPPDGNDDEPSVVVPSSIGRKLVDAAVCSPIGASAGGGGGGDAALRSWFASAVLARLVHECDDAKQIALRMPLALPSTDAGAPEPPRLMPLVASALGSAAHPLPPAVRVGLLTLLCCWLADCPSAIAAFVDAPRPSPVPSLVESVMLPPSARTPHIAGLSALALGLCWAGGDSTQSDALLPLVTHRIGTSRFVAALDGVRKSIAFIAAQQGQAPLDHSHCSSLGALRSAKGNIDISMAFYDHEFTVFYKEHYDDIVAKIAALSGSSGGNNGGNGGGAAATDTPSKRAGHHRRLSSSSAAVQRQNAELQSAVADYQRLVEGYERELTECRRRIGELESAAAPAAAASAAPDAAEFNMLEESLASLSQAYDQLDRLNATKDTQINELRKQLSDASSSSSSLLSPSPLSSPAEFVRLQVQLGDLQTDNKRLTALLDDERAASASLSKQLTLLKSSSSSSSPPPNARTAELEALLSEQQQLYTALEKEQEELLIVLATTELELAKHKKN